MKPERKLTHDQQQRLRLVIQAMDPWAAQVVRAACKRHGLLPGNDQPTSLAANIADPAFLNADSIRGRRK